MSRSNIGLSTDKAHYTAQLHQGCTEVCRLGFKQQGASLIEFSIIAFSVIMLGLSTLQIGLVYHAKTTLNYAVFEAARAGAVNNGKISVMKNELGMRLAPLQGGDGSKKQALAAIAKSVLKMKDPLNTRVEVLNPMPSAFKDWAVLDSDTGKRFIPVNHLRHQPYGVGAQSGLSLRDATLLKIQVTHGVDLWVPIAGKLMTRVMALLDSKNAVFYLRGKWPMQSVATVRMQSDAIEAELAKGWASGGSSSVSDTGGGATGQPTDTTTAHNTTDDDGGHTAVVDATIASDDIRDSNDDVVTAQQPSDIDDAESPAQTPDERCQESQIEYAGHRQLTSTLQFRQLLAQVTPADSQPSVSKH